MSSRFLHGESPAGRDIILPQNDRVSVTIVPAAVSKVLNLKARRRGHNRIDRAIDNKSVSRLQPGEETYRTLSVELAA